MQPAPDDGEAPPPPVIEAKPVDLLVIAVKANNKAMCEAIVLQNPGALQERDSHDGATAAHWAALMGNLELLTWLADASAPVDLPIESSGMAPVHWASTRGHVDVVRFLLKRGVEIDAQDGKLTTPLAIAAQYDHTLLVFTLVQSRANIQLLDHCEDSALHWAAYKGNQQSVALLHYLGLPADKADSYGSTPLHLATAQGCSTVVEYLLESSEVANLIQLKDSKGRTPLDVAKERGHRHVLRMLQTAQPTFVQRVLKGLTGQGGEKVMCIFFVVNSLLVAVVYALVFVPAEIGTVYQTATFFGSCALMYLFHLLAMLADPGFVPIEGKAHDLYWKALKLAADGCIEEAERIGALCHTCRIARPLRSKHCTMAKRCVSVFDHNCPYVNNTIGARNYLWFLIFMLFGWIAITLALAACVQHALYVGHPPWLIFLAVDLSFCELFAVLMNCYHFTLFSRNLTTNEQMNVGRYQYLRDDLGRFSNAFDKGWCANVSELFARRQRLTADPYHYTHRFAEIQKEREEQLGLRSDELAGAGAVPAASIALPLLPQEGQDAV